MNDNTGHAHPKGAHRLLALANSDRHGERFTMLWAAQLAPLLDHARDKALTPLDLVVLLALVEAMPFPTGRIAADPATLAARLGMTRGHLVRSIVRLRRLGFLARMPDPRTGEMAYLLNPELASVGGAARRGETIGDFREAMERFPVLKRSGRKPKEALAAVA
jgi:DNA-binding MarR family transcriptional regulator